MKTKLKKIPFFFREAQQISKNSEHRCKIGTVIVHKNKVISKGYNLEYCFNDFQNKFNKLQSLHAEMMAILRLKNKRILKHCELYNYRQDKKKNLSICRPCEITCMKVLKGFGLSTIYYTDYDGYYMEKI